jgi:SSS family solute:Na+ symporter
MGGTTWVYIMLGIYIIYCFYWGLKGYFTEKTSSGLRYRRTVDSLFRLPAGSNGGIVLRVDLHRPSGPDLAGRSGLCVCIVLRTDHSHHRYLLFKTYLAAGQTLRLHHPGRHVRLLLQHEPLRFLVVLTAVLYSMFYSAVQLMASAACSTLSPAYRSPSVPSSWRSSSGSMSAPAV